MQNTVNNEKKLLKILCHDIFDFVKLMVNKYSPKQSEKDIINNEETFVRVFYKDFVDADIFGDFSLLMKDNFYII